MCDKTFQNLDLESEKLLLNFDLSIIWEYILTFGTKGRTRSPIFEQKIEVSYCVSPYIRLSLKMEYNFVCIGMKRIHLLDWMFLQTHFNAG